MSAPIPGFTSMFGSLPDAWMSIYQQSLQKAMALPQVREAMQKVRVGITPSRPVYREDNLRLLRYENGETKYAPPVLFVFALVNRPYILDLSRGKSVVSHFVNRGFETYKIDWGIPGHGDRHLGLEDYVLGYMDHAIDVIRERTGHEKINIVGYCMGGSMSAMYTALKPEKVRNLILMAAPVDWSGDESLLKVWTDERYFDVDKMLEVYGNAPPEWLQTSFQWLRPASNIFEKPLSFYDNMQDAKFLEDFFAMETWLNDNIPVAGETFREFVKYCFQQNLLIQGKMEIGGKRVDFRKITCPILNLVAESDHLVPPSQSLPFNDAVSSADRKTIRFKAGHIGLAVSSRAHRDLWPGVSDWLAERSSPARSADGNGAATQ